VLASYSLQADIDLGLALHGPFIPKESFLPSLKGTRASEFQIDTHANRERSQGLMLWDVIKAIVRLEKKLHSKAIAVRVILPLRFIVDLRFVENKQKRR
jgi:hypothetical protein